MRAFLALVVGAVLLGPLSARGDRPPWGRGESQGEDLAISVATFGPGDELVSWFGHTALIVEDRRLNRGRLYNYGMFSFDETMLARYALGQLTFWVGEDGILGTFRAYQLAGRDVRVQELNLLPPERLKLAQMLADNVLPENRNYLYQHYFDNCSTRPRDLIDKAIGGQLKRATMIPGRLTLRGHTQRHSAVSPVMSVVLDFVMNDEIDHPIHRWDEGFLPEELEAILNAATYVNSDGQRVALVGRTWTYFQSQRPPVLAEPPRYGGWLAGLGALLGLIPVAARRLGEKGRRRLLGAHATLFGLLGGIPGLVLMLMWMFTQHSVAWRNENLFLVNPLTLLLLPVGVATLWGSSWAPLWLERLWLAHGALALSGLALKLLPAFDQDNRRILALFFPIIAGTAGAYLYDAWRRRGARELSPARAVRGERD